VHVQVAVPRMLPTFGMVRPRAAALRTSENTSSRTFVHKGKKKGLGLEKH